MKQLQGKLWAKITALLLLMVFAATAVLSCVGLCVLAMGDVYIDGGESLRESAYGSIVCQQLNEAVNAYEDYQHDGAQNGDEDGFLQAFLNHYSRENTNLIFTLLDEDGAVLATNDMGEPSDYPCTDTYTIRTYSGDQTTETYSFAYYDTRQEFIFEYENTSGQTLLDYHVYDSVDPDTNQDRYMVDVVTEACTERTITAKGAMAQELSAMDEFRRSSYWLELLLSMKDLMLLAAILSLLLCIALFVFLLCAAGHKEGVEGITLCWLNRVPFDLTASVLISAGVTIVAILADGSYGSTFAYLVLLGGGELCLLLLMALLMSFAAQAKAGKWWHNTICWRLWRFLCHICRWCWRTVTYPLCHLSDCWKPMALVAAVTLTELVITMLAESVDVLMIFWFLERAVLLFLAAALALSFRRIESGGRALAGGDLSYQIETGQMLPPFRQHAAHLNEIGNGMQKAVAQQMKSERMKTELITNVSHDIKTPLTSIVNYVGLMKTLELKDETAQEYLEVLDRQSNRLRKLTEDLVEASKASTGNLTTTLERTDLHLLLQQAAGEYEDRLRELQLEPVLRLAGGEAPILADGKLLWRVFDNLMSNICKYSLPGTRVYLSTELHDGHVTASFKNISRYELDISTDELMERFVRGDASRSTEGSGLGLSIAQSLTRLQGGSFQLSIDGDLFRADVDFPLLNEELQ